MPIYKHKKIENKNNKKTFKISHYQQRNNKISHHQQKNNKPTHHQPKGDEKNK